jgi:dihydrofolate reductase
MRKLVVTEFVSLDGVIEDPGGSESTKYGGWTFKFPSDEAMKFKFEELKASDIQLLGRITYEGFAKAWPTMTGTGEFGEKMNAMPKYVVSTTLKKGDWNNTHIIDSNVVEEITKLKEENGGDILVAGSAILVQTLLEYDLVDELRLMVYPVILGTGKRIFQKDLGQKALKYLSTQEFSNGVMLLTYGQGK